jgi:hypothetical protein
MSLPADWKNIYTVATRISAVECQSSEG